MSPHILFAHTVDTGLPVPTPSGVNVVPLDLITLRSTELHVCVCVCVFFSLEVVCCRCKALIWVTEAKHKVPLLSSSPPHEDTADTVYYHAFITSVSCGAQCSVLCCSCFTPTAHCMRG